MPWRKYDIKRVLAFSTISQLGFMVAAIGVGAYMAAVFHLLAHAFFKALLFLGSGSVIHGVEHGHEHVEHAHGHTDDEAPGHGEHAASAPEFDAQDMRNMGGLRKRMPITFWTFVAGGMALAGFPFITAGFWSKDEILADAFHGMAGGSTLAGIVFVVLAFSALLTAFYTARQISLTFLGEPRSEAAASASESVPSMTFPLIVLACFAVLFGFTNVPPEFPAAWPTLRLGGRLAAAVCGPAVAGVGARPGIQCRAADHLIGGGAGRAGPGLLDVCLQAFARRADRPD